ncbi:hypothetical protein CCP3SC1AL1_110043 [Gammaproteobacteria bacterium]
MVDIQRPIIRTRRGYGAPESNQDTDSKRGGTLSSSETRTPGGSKVMVAPGHRGQADKTTYGRARERRR